MPVVFPWERRRLLSFRDDLVFKPYMVFEVRSGVYAVALYRWVLRGVCPFLASDGKCSIHERKPLSCKIFPLLVGIEDGTLRVSLACKLVSSNLEKFSGDPSKLFPEEYPQALKAYILVKVLEEYASLNGWRKIYVAGELAGTLVDIDELIEVDDILGEIERKLAKYVEKHA